MSVGLAGQNSVAKKIQPKRSDGWRFICPDPNGVVLPAEEVYFCIIKKSQMEL
ncbi:MAG: hypothetical protein H7325_07675 [Pedobacter sp.]|nr:hypothetical protein [Pedobacter sp.]